MCAGVAWLKGKAGPRAARRTRVPSPAGVTLDLYARLHWTTESIAHLAWICGRAFSAAGVARRGRRSQHSCCPGRQGKRALPTACSSLIVQVFSNDAIRVRSRPHAQANQRQQEGERSSALLIDWAPWRSTVRDLRVSRPLQIKLQGRKGRSGNAAMLLDAHMLP